jgi:hypothetical protein
MSKWLAEVLDGEDGFNKEPLALGVLKTGFLDEEAFAKAHGREDSPEREMFGARYAVSLAAGACEALKKMKSAMLDRQNNKEMVSVLSRFAIGAVALEERHCSYAMDVLKVALAESIPYWSSPDSMPGRSFLSTEAKKTLTAIFVMLPDIDSARVWALLDALSDAEKFQMRAIKSLVWEQDDGGVMARAKVAYEHSLLDAEAGGGSASRPAVRI